MNFDLGAYGLYIWLCYLVSAAALIGATVWNLAAWYRAKARLAALENTPRGRPAQKDRP